MRTIASIGWILMALAIVGVLTAVYMEFQAHEPLYTLIMKVCCLLIGMAGIVIGIGKHGEKKQSEKNIANEDV